MPNYTYEGSSVSAVRRWEIPLSRLENQTPTVTEAAAVVSRVAGTQLTGTVLTVDADVAVIDFTKTMVYQHSVRNVLTYSNGEEATFGAINIGDPVFYDRSTTMPSGVYLSTSPLDNTGAANPLFGYVVAKDAPNDVFPKGADGVASTQVCYIMQE